MRFKLGIYLVLLMISCNTKKPESVLTTPIALGDSSVVWVLKKFGLSYPDDLNLDSNRILLYRSGFFDTSYVFQLEKTDFGINGVYYEVLPTNHRYIYDVRKKDQAFFFDGYGFSIDEDRWRSVQTKIRDILVRDTISPKIGCCDGYKYGLFYGGMSKIKGNLDDQSSYDSLSVFLDSIILDGLRRERKPIMQKK